MALNETDMVERAKRRDKVVEEHKEEFLRFALTYYENRKKLLEEIFKVTHLLSRINRITDELSANLAFAPPEFVTPEFIKQAQTDLYQLLEEPPDSPLYDLANDLANGEYELRKLFALLEVGVDNQ